MAKKHLRTLVLLLAALALGSILLMACARSDTGSVSSVSSSSSSDGGSSCVSSDAVKTGIRSFEQACITLSKGSMLNIIQDQTSYHVLDYGQWNGSIAQQQPAPVGASALKDLTLSGSSVSIGPFTAAGTYHVYCTVHPGMDLTVIVK